MSDEQDAEAQMPDEPKCSGEEEAGSAAGEELPISAELLEILACPKCKGELELVVEGPGGGSGCPELICHGCRLAYRIEDGIPIMLIDQARPL